MLSRSCFSETMAPHFEIVDKDIEEVKEKREIENIKLKRTEYWRTVLKSG